jgi:hypothetical protein
VSGGPSSWVGWRLLGTIGFAVASCLTVASPAAADDWESIGAEELRTMPGAHADDLGSRVGQVFWTQPKARPYSVDFFESPELQSRLPISTVRWFVVTAVTSSGDGAALYQVRFDSGTDAFIPVASFEVELYVDPPPQSATPIKSNLYLSPEAYFYSIKSIFSEDPAVLWERIDNLGPTRIRELPTHRKTPETDVGNPKGKDDRNPAPGRDRPRTQKPE